LSVALRPANSLPMKPRHAAALALASWYLMVLPQDIAGGHFRSVPLGSEWKHQGTFDTEFECKREIEKGCGTINQNGEIIGRVGPLCYSRCISSDDPRLKPN
jgi:hypothetical protein